MRNRKAEGLWIFFGIHTANAVLMIDKIKTDPIKQHGMTLQTESEEVFGFLPMHHVLPDRSIREERGNPPAGEGKIKNVKRNCTVTFA